MNSRRRSNILILLIFSVLQAATQLSAAPPQRPVKPARPTAPKATTWQEAVEQANGTIEGDEGERRVTLPELTDTVVLWLGQAKGVVALESYDASKLTIKGWTAIGKLAGLKELKLKDVRATTLNQISGLSKLEVLSLTGAKIAPASVPSLGEFSELRELDLSGSSIADAAFATLKKLDKLETLDLAKTDVTDACVDTVAEMKKLKSLNVSVTRISLEGYKKLNEMRETLKVQY